MAELIHSPLHLVGDSGLSHTTQYLATISASLGGLVMGTGVGYTSPAGPLLMKAATGEALQLTQDQYDWFSSALNLGALAGCAGGGWSSNQLGRRATMLLTVPLSLAGWALIAFGQNLAMLVAGRVLLGACIAATCIAAPTYVGEIASPDIRGALACGYQLMITLGMLLAYVAGVFLTSWRWLALICGAPNLVFLVLVYFTHESPTFLLTKGKMREATTSLQHFRGTTYDIQRELEMTRQSVENTQRNKVTLKELLKPYVLKPFLLSLSVFLTIQVAGTGAILFNLAIIFQASGVRLENKVNAVIVGVVQVIATGLSTVLMDTAGRKLLLVVSFALMSLSLVALGEYFHMMETYSVWTTEKLGWLPLASLLVFIASFALGPAPISWVLLGELFHPRVKETAASLVTLANWGLGFVIILTFFPLQDLLGSDGVYLVFAFMALCGLLITVLALPETKRMTLQEITEFFGGPNFDPTRNVAEDDLEVHQA